MRKLILNTADVLEPEKQDISSCEEAAACPSRREQVTRNLLKAAWETLIRDGYEKITTRRIAAAAGVNIATLHYYFASKERLLTEAVRYAVQGAEKKIESSIQTAGTPEEALKEVLKVVVNIVKSPIGVIHFDLAVRGFRDPEALKEAIDVYEIYRAQFEKLVKRFVDEGWKLPVGVTVATMTHFFLCSLDGIILQLYLTEDADMTRGALDLFEKQVLGLLERR